jgi:hypothetical protein
MGYPEHKIPIREVPPYTQSSMGCLPRAVIIMSAIAFIALAIWIIMAIREKI